ncbi:MAG: glucuronate isomerase [Pirellulales bacterium]
MSTFLRQRLYEQFDQLVLIDPHSHINPHQAASRTLADILGYHYYTELVHSTGVPRAEIEQPDLSPRDRVRLLAKHLPALDNTIQSSWLIEMAQRLFGYTGDRVTGDDADRLFDLAAERMAATDWEQQVLDASRLEAIFLTNDFDDPLIGFDTQRYVPCLRTDDLVFHLVRAGVRERLERAAGTSLVDVASLRRAIGQRFEHFVARGARACAISLPPTFSPQPVSTAAAESAWHELLRLGEGPAVAGAREVMSHFVFWTLAEYCVEFRLPFDLMIGVHRAVYPGGVFQGQDLYDSRVSLYQYRELFNAFPQVTFPISVLASVTNQELTSYSWIFPNVITHGHWWYSNTTAYIESDTAARLEAVPRTKQIGYYSDMYKLEFALPKFNMYKRVLAKVLADRFVIDRGWSEERAVELGTQVLRGNVERIFYPERA